MKRLIYIFLVSLLHGCYYGSYSDLGDSYIYMDGSIDRRINKTHVLENLVPIDVLNYDFDKKHIIVYQRPDSDAFRKDYIDTYDFFTDSTMQYQHEVDSLEVLLDSMLKIKDCYWIIRKKNCKVFGPMTESDFNQECKKRNIKLKMDKRYEKFHYEE